MAEAANRYLRLKFDDAYEVRRADTRDAVGIADLLYRTFGYTCRSRESGVYDPDAIHGLLQSGAVASFIACVPSGKVVAHVAMRPAGPPGVLDVAELAVDPEFGRQEIAVAVSQALYDAGKAAGARKLTTKVITFHHASQKVCEQSFGFKPGAILLGAHPETIAFRAFAGRPAQRESFVEEHCFYAKRRLQVFLPPRHEDAIRRLYAAAELERDVGPAAAGVAPGTVPKRSEIATDVRESWLAGYLQVNGVGLDVAARVARIVADFRAGYLKHVEVRVPIDTPAGAHAVEAIEAQGFFFAGVDFDRDGRDHVVLTTLLDGGIDPGGVKLRHPAAVELLDYVKTLLPARGPEGPAAPDPRPRLDPGAARACVEEAHGKRLRVAKQLAAGLAHEINNPLNIILGTAYFLKQRLKGVGPGDEVARHLATIEDEVARVARLLDNLQKFAEPEELARAPVDLGRTCEDTLALLERFLESRGLTVVRRFAKETPAVLGNSSQIAEVLVQLLLNAADASPVGAAIDVETGREDGGEGATLVVRDHGAGIPADVMPRLFEPFVSTKDVGAGTGLGLAIVQGLVETHGGTIEIRSAPGEGTAAVVRLPAVRDESGRSRRGEGVGLGLGLERGLGANGNGIGNGNGNRNGRHP